MRGASAVQSALDERKEARIRLFVIWEPVLPTDWAAPSTGVLSRVNDVRAVQFWDQSRLLSERLGGPSHRPRGNNVDDVGFAMSKAIWDFVAIYPAGSDRPSLTGAPVVNVMDAVREELAKAQPR